MRQTIILIALALVAATVQAQQPMYRSVMPDGHIVYGDKPAPGAKESKQVNLAPLNISTPTQPGATSGEAQQQAASAADAEVKNAQQALDAAKAALESSREPQPGERIGTASGASRLNEAYFQRIQSLEQAVAAAQQRLDEARRNAR